MSIHFISGKPGGGKSLYGLKLIIEELVCGHRAVYTNLALRVPELNAYLQETRGSSVDIFRVRVLNDDETASFWTYRPGGVRIKQLTKEDWAGGQRPCYSAVQDNGVMYVIDEVHNFFGARQWSETGRDVLFYLSQHRKLGDTVICISQAIGNVDKQFRSLTQDFTFLRNLSKERWGKFRLPGVFVRKTFLSPPTDNSTPMETGTFRLDVSGLCKCYDSAQGVGIHGRDADSKEVRRGVHWVWSLVIILAVVFLVFRVAPRALASFWSAPLKRAVSVSVGPVGSPVVPGGVHGGPGVASAGRVDAAAPLVGGLRHVVVTPAAAGGVGSNAVCVTSCVVWTNGVYVGLSDGRIFRWPGDKRLQFVGRDYVVIDGEAYHRRGY